MTLAGYYNRQGQFDKTIEALEQRAKAEPNNPDAFQTIAAYYWDETRGDSSLSEAQKRDYLQKGVEAADKALALKSDFVDGAHLQRAAAAAAGAYRKGPCEAAAAAQGRNGARRQGQRAAQGTDKGRDRLAPVFTGHVAAPPG